MLYIFKNMLEQICQKTDLFINRMPKNQRKTCGQFFTSKETARFMASLLVFSGQKKISILDAGAGSGILSVAVIERLVKECPGISIELTCYENDGHVLPLLRENLEWVKLQIENFSFKIIEENYITSQKENFNFCISEKTPVKYDIVIGNPPFKKISKNAEEAKAMPGICHGAPNLYFLFAAMGIFNLNDGGEMVYITPRSWTSGAYFENFRKYLISNVSLERIHLFKSRSDVFDRESILQETVIFKLRKIKHHQQNIVISTTAGNGDFDKQTKFEVAYETVVSSRNLYIYLPSCEKEVDALCRIESFTHTLPDLDMKMKTGLVVNFRVPELLESCSSNSNVPLFFGKHIKNGKVFFPVGVDNEYVSRERKSLLQQNRNYLFVKRFSSKEEKRRLQCGVYLKRTIPNSDYISTQNKINYIDGKEELSECTVYGLFVLFNSTLYDSYYRILNGSTQVNSTEINAIPVPELAEIQTMGKKLLKNKDMSEYNCDRILNEVCA